MTALKAQVPDMPYAIAGVMASMIAGLGVLALAIVAFRL
jgi:hypothetical protein